MDTLMCFSIAEIHPIQRHRFYPDGVRFCPQSLNIGIGQLFAATIYGVKTCLSMRHKRHTVQSKDAIYVRVKG